MPPTGFQGRYGKAPSAARLVYEHYAPSHPELARHEALLAETDRLDSAQLSGRTWSRPRATSSSASPSTRAPASAACASTSTSSCPRCATGTIEEVLALPSVQERATRMREQDQAFREAALAHSRLDGSVVLVTDFRALEPIPVGNRFLIFTLFPEAPASRCACSGARAREGRGLGRPLDPQPHLARQHRRADVALRRRRPRRGRRLRARAPAGADAQIAEIVSALKRNG